MGANRLAEIEARLPFTDGGDVAWLLARVHELERDVAVADSYIDHHVQQEVALRQRVRELETALRAVVVVADVIGLTPAMHWQIRDAQAALDSVVGQDIPATTKEGA